MDPHSRLSQYNQRGPKSGPLPTSRFVSEMMNKPTLDTFSSMQTPTAKKKSKGSSPASTLLIRRPIATNSRIKQNENYRKDMYLAFVTNALRQKLNGNSEPYDELVSQFNPKRRTDPSSTDLSTSLRIWILALTHVVSRLERTHSSLVEAVVNMPWTTLDSATVKSYTVFIGMLLSARPEYLSLVLGKVAQGFTYQSGLQTLSQAFPESSASPITRRVIYDRLHYLLQHLLSLVPTLPSTLRPLLVRTFPHKRQNQLTQSTYIRNLLRVSSYCPELSERILATIVDRAIQIDVEIQVELEELEDEETSEEPLFEIDPFDVVLGQEEHESSDLSDVDDSDDEIGDDFSDLSSDAGGLDDEVPPELPTNVKHIQEMVKKLDSILTLMFEHFKRTHSIPSSNPTTPGEPGSSSASRPPSPPELTILPPLPPLSSDPFVASPISPDPTPAFPDRTPERTPAPGSRSALSVEPSTSTSLQSTMNTMRTQFNALLSIFERTILRTFKSRYTQFLIFWYTSLDPEFADIFQGMLVERALLGTSSTGIHVPGEPLNEEDGSNNSASMVGGSTITRAAAASYIGSFVSRAVFVDGESARRVVAVLCEFLKVHLDDVEESLRLYSATVNIGGPQHTVFYAVAQAVFLIFCFRWRDLLNLREDEDGEGYAASTMTASGQGETDAGGKARNWMPELGVLQRVVNSVLNPLRVCSFNVVMQFARVAQATDFIYCYTILESNKRLESTSTLSTHPNMTSPAFNQPALTQSNAILTLKGSESGCVTAELNTFFPFDPYRLPRSAIFIKEVYREWSSVAIDSESDDDEESEAEDAGEYDTSGGVPSSSPGGERYLAIPQTSSRRGTRSEGEGDDTTGGLGESLEQMSISPIRGGVTSTSISMNFVG